MMKRRTVLTHTATVAALATVPLGALAQGRKDAIVLAMALEPPGLDPTAGAASAIAKSCSTTSWKHSQRSIRTAR